MSDDLKVILYGRTEKVMLADGKEYILREPNLSTLDAVDIDLADIAKTSNVRKLLFIMIKEDQPEMTEDQVGRLVTFSMLKDTSPVMKTIFSILGVKNEKNVEAGPL